MFLPTRIQLIFSPEKSHWSSSKHQTRGNLPSSVDFAAIFSPKRRDRRKSVGAPELLAAEVLWIKTEQTKFLPVELAYLTNGKGSGPSLVSQLDLFLDRERFVRCSGRLRYTHLSKETKHPIFIPRQSLLTLLIIRAYHERNFHSGPGNTVNSIRQCYWINCALSVKLALCGCTFWRREDGSPYIAPDHAALPDFRVTPSFPFTATGIDYTSAYIVRTDNGDIKVYISLFTCAASRALYI